MLLDDPGASAPRPSAPPVGEPDILGAPFTCETIDLGTAGDGPLVATLVTAPAQGESRGAVLYVHGFCDYFFQREYALWWTARGYTFYALDLRRYGRSLRPHHRPNHVDDLSEYHQELDEAYRLITERDGHTTVVLSAHSTGGLVLPLWVNERQLDVAGIVLNSPWLDMHGGWVARYPGTAVVKAVAHYRPDYVLPRTVSGIYGRSLHVDHSGEWEFDTTWKSLDSFPVRSGWLSAVRRGHQQVHRGLDVAAPVLVLSSARSTRPSAMLESVHTSDIVLDVRQIRRWASSLGTHVTSIAVEGGRHDLLLSRAPVRAKVMDEIDRWLTAYVEVGERAPVAGGRQRSNR